MGIAGAALYSLALIAGRELAQVLTGAKRPLRSAWQAFLYGAALCGAGLYPRPHTKSRQ